MKSLRWHVALIVPRYQSRQCRRYCATSTHSRHHIPSRYDQGASSGVLIDLYNTKVQAGVLKRDPKQELTVKKLQVLAEDYIKYEQQLEVNTASSNSGLFGRLFSKKTAAPPSSLLTTAPRGFYMYGDVGCGKTMLMDLFLEALPSSSKKKRVHFNSFMQSFHEAMYKWRETPESRAEHSGTAIEKVTDAIVQDSKLLCFDEFQVTNIADAMMLGRLFRGLWTRGAVVVATSNRPPDDLYKNGLQRALFVPFIHELKDRCYVHYINSEIDYRLTGQKVGDLFFVSESPAQHDNRIQQVWDDLTEKRPGEPTDIHVKGRTIHVSQAFKGIARFTFAELCERPMGAADYGAIASAFHTVLLSHIPKMTLDHRDKARRFITLIDELYEHQVKLVATADAPAEQLFPRSLDKSAPKLEGLSNPVEEEIFAFSRTLSRLNEMQSADYLQAKHIPHPHDTAQSKEGHTPKHHGHHHTSHSHSNTKL